MREGDDGRRTTDHGTEPDAVAVAEWLNLFGAESVEGVGEDFAPRTLKEVLAGALGLGNSVGRLGEAMRVLGGGEERLAALAARLGLDRRTGTVGGQPFPAAALVTALGDGTVTLSGRWGPDLLEKAGARPLGPAPGEGDAVWSLDTLTREAPAVVIFAGDEPPPPDVVSRFRVRLSSTRLFHLDATRVNRPGPSLVRTVELLAAAVHGAAAGVRPAPGELVPL